MKYMYAIVNAPGIVDKTKHRKMLERFSFDSYMDKGRQSHWELAYHMSAFAYHMTKYMVLRTHIITIFIPSSFL
jgi:hypothetical protein